MSKVHLLTGGTGFLGSLLSLALLKQRKEVVFLGRSKSSKSFQKRIERVLSSIEPHITSENIKAIEVDLHSEDLGIPHEWVNQLSGKVEAIWHLAADLSFREQDRKKIFTTNLGGLKNILNLASRLKSPVYYTSTAYVHGRRPGVIFENELIRPDSFNNPYEESKFEAEKMIRKWGEDGNKFIIFRPSIFIETGRRTLSSFGYYAVVYGLYAIKKRVGGEQVKICFPFPYSKGAFLNLMPIDIAIKWMIEISGNSKALGKTFHITNPLPFPMRDVTKQTFDALHIKIPLFEAPKWFIRLSFSILYFISFIAKPLRTLVKKLYYYRYYMTEYNVYNMKNTIEIVGQNVVDQFHFPSDFVWRVAGEFVKKLEQTDRQAVNVE